MKYSYIVHVSSSQILDDTLSISLTVREEKRGIDIKAVFITNAGQGLQGDALLVIEMESLDAGELKRILDRIGVHGSRLYRNFEW